MSRPPHDNPLTAPLAVFLHGFAEQVADVVADVVLHRLADVRVQPPLACGGPAGAGPSQADDVLLSPAEAMAYMQRKDKDFHALMRQHAVRPVRYGDRGRKYWYRRDLARIRALYEVAPEETVRDQPSAGAVLPFPGGDQADQTCRPQGASPKTPRALTRAQRRSAAAEVAEKIAAQVHTWGAEAGASDNARQSASG